MTQATTLAPLGGRQWFISGEGGGECTIYRYRNGTDVLLHMRHCDGAQELVQLLNEGNGPGALDLLLNIKPPKKGALAWSLRQAIPDMRLLIDLYC